MAEELLRARVELSAAGHGDIVLQVGGEIDAVAAPVFRARLAAVIEANDHDVVVDLADVTFMDSSGLAVLAEARQRCHASTRQLLLARPSARVVRLLEIAGLDGWLDHGSTD